MQMPQGQVGAHRQEKVDTERAQQVARDGRRRVDGDGVDDAWVVGVVVGVGGENLGVGWWVPGSDQTGSNLPTLYLRAPQGVHGERLEGELDEARPLQPPVICVDWCLGFRQWGWVS